MGLQPCCQDDIVKDRHAPSQKKANTIVQQQISQRISMVCETGSVMFFSQALANCFNPQGIVSLMRNYA